MPEPYHIRVFSALHSALASLAHELCDVTASYHLLPGCVPESTILASSTAPKRALLNTQLYLLLCLCPQARQVVSQFASAKSHRRKFWSAGPCSPLWASVGCRVGPRLPVCSQCRHCGSPRLSTRPQLAQPHLFQKQCNSNTWQQWQATSFWRKRLMKKVSITLCSFGTGNGKTFAHLPHYPCYRHRRFPWQRCIQAPSSRSGRHTASCSDPACISRCHCTNQGSHLVEEMEKVSTSTPVHTATQTPDTLLCRQKGSFLLVG